MPETCWLTPSTTVSSAISNPTSAPVANAATTPSQVAAEIGRGESVMATSSMVPSMPRLSTPKRSRSSSPMVASSSGVAIRSNAAKKAEIDHGDEGIIHARHLVVPGRVIRNR